VDRHLDLSRKAIELLETMSERVIVIDREIMSGQPCFRGTQVPLKNLIDYLEGGHSLGEFLHQCPTVTREMAVRALARQDRMKILLDECLPLDFPMRCLAGARLGF